MFLSKTAGPLRYPDRRLRKPCVPLTSETLDAASGLVKLMLETVRELGVAGLAANQVGWPESIAVVSASGSEPFCLINPVIVAHATGNSVRSEGCLSLPGVSVDVPRSAWVTVEFIDAEGTPRTERFEGEGARTVQHEIDHLRGKLILDYLSPLKRAKLKSGIRKCLRMERENVNRMLKAAGPGT